MSDGEGERGSDMYVSLNETKDYEFIVENVGDRAAKFTMTVSIR